MKMKKRGVSNVIATVLVLVMTIIAFAILASFVVPFVNDKLEGSTECLQYKDYFGFVDEIEFDGETYNYNCFTKDANREYTYGFSIGSGRLNSEEMNLGGFNIVFYNSEGESEVVSIRDNVPLEGDIATFTEFSEKEFIKMEVYPVLEDGKVCQKSDEIKIKECADNVNFEGV